jgi:hypothetical protein
LCFLIPRKTLRLAGQEHGRAIPLADKADFLTGLFDGLFGLRVQAQWDRDSKCLRRSQIDDQVKFGVAHNRQIRRPLALQNAADIDAGLPTAISDTGPVTHQPTHLGELA